MWDHVGVTRTPSGLETALDDLNEISAQVEDLYATCPTLEMAAVRDVASAGWAVTAAALRNPNSVGAHHVVPEAELSDSEEDMVAAAQ